MLWKASRLTNLPGPARHLSYPDVNKNLKSCALLSLVDLYQHMMAPVLHERPAHGLKQPITVSYRMEWPLCKVAPILGATRSTRMSCIGGHGEVSGF